MINYYLLTKPGIIMGNIITVAAGFALASTGLSNYKLFLATLAGLSLVIASACVFNNYIDRFLDQNMKRTQKRALASGLITIRSALVFAIILGLLGLFILGYYTNLLTVCIASAGFFIYVVPYSMWKRHTIYGTAIGSIAGAVPPVVGYCALSNRLDFGALLFFLMMIFWQMPHFFAIAIHHLDDYTAASIPVLPIKKGMRFTKVRMTLYIIAFILTAPLLTFLGYTGYAYLSVMGVLGMVWLILCLKGFTCSDDTLWAKQMFRFSLVTVMGLCIMIPMDTAQM